MVVINSVTNGNHSVQSYLNSPSWPTRQLGMSSVRCLDRRNEWLGLLIIACLSGHGNDDYSIFYVRYLRTWRRECHLNPHSVSVWCVPGIIGFQKSLVCSCRLGIGTQYCSIRQQIRNRLKDCSQSNRCIMSTCDRLGNGRAQAYKIASTLQRIVLPHHGLVYNTDGDQI